MFKKENIGDIYTESRHLKIKSLLNQDTAKVVNAATGDFLGFFSEEDLKKYKKHELPRKVNGKFNVVIEETLRRVIPIDAETSDEALSIVEKGYREQKYILDASDFVGEQYYIINE